jgi:hypothetical protein
MFSEQISVCNLVYFAVVDAARLRSSPESENDFSFLPVAETWMCLVEVGVKSWKCPGLLACEADVLRFNIMPSLLFPRLSPKKGYLHGLNHRSRKAY